jgi:hypothetical protein
VQVVRRWFRTRTATGVIARRACHNVSNGFDRQEVTMTINERIASTIRGMLPMRRHRQTNRDSCPDLTIRAVAHGSNTYLPSNESDDGDKTVFEGKAHGSNV